jgi:glutamate carboxypeptidase
VARTVTEEIRAFVETNAEEQLEFVLALSNQNSYTYNAQGTGFVAEMVLDRLEGLFAEHEVNEQSEVGDHHILRTDSASTSTGARSVYILGHLDTVFPPEHPFQKCTQEGDWLIGPGTGDMKGGLAVIVYALKCLEYMGLLDRLNLVLMLGSDEEVGSVTSRPLYELERGRACACLVAECAGSRGEVVISRNGKTGARLDCFGIDSHVAAAKADKASAILEMAHKVVGLEALNGKYPNASVNVGRIDGGLGPSTVPGRASCLFDLRWSEEGHYETLLRDVQGIVKKKFQAACSCKLTLLNQRPAMPASKGTEELFRLVKQSAESLGMSLEAEHRRGTSDANFFGAAGIPTLDGFGPISTGDHTEDERIAISSLQSRTALLALFLGTGRYF